MVPSPLVTLGDLAAHLHLRGRGDVAAEPSGEGIVQDVAEQAVEVVGAAAVEEGGVRGVLAGTPIVAGVGVTGAVGGGLALRPGEGRRAEAAWAQVARHTRTSVPAVQTAAEARVILAG